MRPVAIIESDAAARVELRRAVEGGGFRTDCFTDGTAALATLRARSFSLAILDLDASGGDPFAVCRELSQVVPVITVTSGCDTETCIRALDSGADDCLTRPLAPRELVARVRGVLRRAEQDGEGDLELDALRFSAAEMRVRHGEEVHELTRGEAELLSLLVKHAPTPLSPVAIAAILGAKRGTVESRIKSLRRKVGAERLLTRPRLGYYLALD